MIGPGAGIAPFKGFLDDKAFGNQAWGSMTLFFGCKG
jgi:sulfite reductase alpha subunit-like flavoprotein